LSKGIWYINQCDSCINCLYFIYDDYRKNGCYHCKFRTLNPEKEVSKLCKYFKIKTCYDYGEEEIYNNALNSYFFKMHLPYNGREQYLNLSLEEKRKKCIELNLLCESDFKIVENEDYIKNSLSNLPLDDDELNLRNTEEYLLWQKEVFKRDKYKCVICGSNKNLNAHHLDSFAKYPDLRYVLDNGVTLCEKHHDIKCKNSFHNVYGTRNFTKDDFFMYKNNQTKERLTYEQENIK
jgi:hypothetical protein